MDKIKGDAFAPGMRKLYAKLREFKPEILMGGLINHLDLVALAHILDCACLFFGLQTRLPSKHVPALGLLPRFPSWTGLNHQAWKLLGKLAIYDMCTKNHLPVLEEISGMRRERFWPSFEDFWGLYYP